jgi:2-oxoglutarate ferredoxin oxidoreductase subunit alpha
MNALRKKGQKVGLIRPVTLWPFPKNVFERIIPSAGRPAFLVVEMSYGQMLDDVKLSLNGRARIEFLGRSGGGIPTEKEIINKVNNCLRRMH